MNQKLGISVIGVLIVLISSGCTQPIRPHNGSYVETVRVLDRTYDLGQQITSFVGETMTRVEQYHVNRLGSEYMRASDDFVISGGIVTISGTKETDYLILGDTIYNGISYIVVNLAGPRPEPGFRALIEPGGGVHSKVLNNDIVMVYNFRASPSHLRFIRSAYEEIDTDAGFLNYELIYGGIDGSFLTISYREYAPDDLARPAFFQDIRHEIGVTQIRFRNTVLQIHEATNNRIVFTVLSDDLE